MHSHGGPSRICRSTNESSIVKKIFNLEEHEHVRVKEKEKLLFKFVTFVFLFLWFNISFKE
jgi:hypothetical protein